MTDTEAGAGAGSRPSSGTRRERPWRLMAGLGWMGLVCAVVAVAVGRLWRDDLSGSTGWMLRAHWVAFMAATFVFHAGIAMAAVGVFALVTRRRVMAVAAAVVMVAGAGPELVGMATRGAAEARGGDAVKIMSVNLMYGLMDADALLAQIEREAPDVVLFQEWTGQAERALKPRLRARFAHAVESTRDDAFGEAVFSTRGWTRPGRMYPPRAGVGGIPQICVGVAVDGREMLIANVHLLPPVRPSMFAEQRAMARGLAEWASSRDEGPHVMAGDFNAVGGSSVMRAFARAGMADALDAAGPRWSRGTTWPRRGWLRHAPGVGIDHVLVNDEVVCVEARTGEDFGSDHRPVVAVVKWRGGSAR